MRNIKKYTDIRIILASSLMILLVLGVSLVFSTFNKTYALNDNTFYRYIDRVESGYFVRYLKKGATERSSKYDTGYIKLGINGDPNNILNVFCAFRGKPLSTDATYYRQNFEQFYSSYSEEWRIKLAGIVMLYTPESPIEELRSYLQTNYPAEYTRAGLDKLKSSEAEVAFQTAIWVFTNGDSDYNSNPNDEASNLRINTLHKILLQENGYLRNLDVNTDDGSYFDSVTFYLYSDLALNEDNNRYEASLVTYDDLNINSDHLSLVLKTNNGTIISDDSYSISYTDENGKILHIEFNENTFGTSQNGRLSLLSNNESFDTIYITAEVIRSMPEKTVFIYVSDDTDCQNLIGTEKLPNSSLSYINLSAPESAKVSFEIEKVDEDNLSESAISNAYLKLYRVEGSNNILVDQWLTTQDKKIINDLLPGTYKIVETLYPEGYQNGTSSMRVDGSNIYVASDKTFTVTADYSKYNISVLNKPIEIKLRKVDSTGNNYVEGASFVIVDSESVKHYEIPSTTNGDISIKSQLSSGTYFLIEIEAPTNYIKSDKAYRFKVGDAANFTANTITKGEYKDLEVVDALYDSASKVITIQNNKGLSISKKSIVDNATYVIGATLEITNQNGEVVESWVTTNKDHIITKELIDGTYTLTEKIPGPGYATAESITFEIQDGMVINNQDINMKDAPLQVCIAKKASNVNGNLDGAKFELYDKDNNLVTKFTSEKTAHCFPVSLGLTPGNYILKEVEAPKGYEKAKDITITIKDTSELQLFEVNNEVKVPITSLNTSIIIYIAMLIMGTVGIGLVCYYVKRYNY